MEEVIDGREASLKVREYFEEVHGLFSVLAFSVEEAAYEEDKKAWEIICNFFPGSSATHSMRYEVEVDARDGRILKVKQLEPEK
ncbi:MAG: hypothetical protein ACXQTW_05375 [Candidatus Methanospirareceae archaeon]